MKRQQGLSLIEVMITVLIVGILAGISIPYYKDYSLRAHRVDARNALLGAAQKLQLYFLANNQYPDKNAGTAILTQYGFDKTPASGATRYEITYEEQKVEKISAPVFTADSDESEKKDIEATNPIVGYFLTAEAVGKQTKDKCKVFVLNSRGVKEAYNVAKVGLDFTKAPNKKYEKEEHILPNECWR